jgi:hypothetical protein
MKMGLGFYGRPSKGGDKSEMFDIYYDYGIKVKRSEELQADYLELPTDRLGQVGLDMPDGVEADYDMRVGYGQDAAEWPPPPIRCSTGRWHTSGATAIAVARHGRPRSTGIPPRTGRA